MQKAKFKTDGLGVAGNNYVSLEAGRVFWRCFAPTAMAHPLASQLGMNKTDGSDIRRRTFLFACAVAKVCLAAQTPRSFVIVNQLLKASTSIGANLEEAKAGSSRKEFARMCEISLREARETVYWLRVGQAVGVLPSSVDALRQEGEEIKNILGAIVVNTKRRTLAKAVAMTTVLVLLVCLRF